MEKSSPSPFPPLAQAPPVETHPPPVPTCKIACAIALGSFCEMADEHRAKIFPGGDIYNIHFFPGSSPNSIGFTEWKPQLPGATSFIGCTRKDKSGEEIKTNAKLAVMIVPYYEDENAPTGTCAVSVLVGERSLIANLSSANCYKSDHFKQPENWALVEKAKYFYIAGFFLTESPASIQLVPEHAAANDKIFMMNLSAPFICEFFKDAQEKVLLYMDFVFGNETEARTFSKIHHGWEIDDLEEIALKISQWPKASGTYKRFTIVTQGSDLDDTNGAGDAFVGRCLSQLVQEKTR